MMNNFINLKNKVTSSNEARWIVLTSLSFLLAACQSTSAVAGSERVRIFEAEPKGCLYMGEVSSIQDNDDPVVGRPVEMTLETRMDLRNKAHKLNGNVLVFMTKARANVANSNTTVTDVATKASGAKPDPKAEAKTEVKAEASKATSEVEPEEKSVFLGTAFRCPPQIYNQ